MRRSHSRLPLPDLTERTASAPLRLLVVATLPEPGGACTHLVSLTHALLQQGHEVTLVATDGRGVWEELPEQPGLTKVRATFRERFDASAMACLRGLLARERFDHVFAVCEQDYWGTWRAAREQRVPVAFFLHHAGMTRTNRLLLPLTRPTYLVPSNDLREWICERRVSRSRVHVLPNPIDTAHFARDTAARDAVRSRHGFDADDVVIGFVGRLEYNKGVLSFAEALNAAMSRHARVRALWVGSGRREAEVDAIIARAADPSRHVRIPWASDVRPLYSAMDVLALPSTGRESFGRVLAEAQSCGVPVLGSDIGGIPMALHAGVSGVLVPPGNAPAWTDAIVDLATNTARREAMGGAGRAFVQAHFESREVAAQLVAFVRSHTPSRA